MSKILVALSGGLDSAAVVLMLREQGFDVEALYIDMIGCQASRLRAIELAAKLDVTLHIENVEREFCTQIIQHTLSEHQAGRTPSPCARCNPQIKWRTLSAVADRLAIEKIATGHYIGIVQRGDRFFVASALDPIKDQSYYLWALDQDILSRAVTPLGGFLKRDVRAFLADRGFGSLALGGESMGLCFLRGQSYTDFLATNLPVALGQVRNTLGEVVGEHNGFQLYTIGQKRGFVSSELGEVRAIEPSTNRVVVGESLYAKKLYLTDCVINSLDFDHIWVKVRGLGRNPQGEVRVERYGDCLLVCLLEDQAWAPAAGQPVVLYSSDLLVAGGLLSADTTLV